MQVQFYLIFPVLILLIRPLMRARPAAMSVLGLLAVAAYAGNYSVGAWASSAGGNWPFNPAVVAPETESGPASPHTNGRRRELGNVSV